MASTKYSERIAIHAVRTDSHTIASHMDISGASSSSEVGFSLSSWRLQHLSDMVSMEDMGWWRKTNKGLKNHVCLMLSEEFASATFRNSISKVYNGIITDRDQV